MLLRLAIAAGTLAAGIASAQADVTVYRKSECLVGQQTAKGITCKMPVQARYHYDRGGNFTGYVTYGQHKGMAGREAARAARVAKGRAIAADPNRSGYAIGDEGVGEPRTGKLNDDSFPRRAIVKFQIDG